MRPKDITCPKCSQEKDCYDWKRNQPLPPGEFHSARIKKAAALTEGK